MAPSRSDRSGSGTIRDSSYSSTAPNPLQPGHAPRGLLNENRPGVSGIEAVPQSVHRGCCEKRSRSSPARTSAMPSPSANASASESASRARTVGAKRMRSTTTSAPSRSKRASAGSSSRRHTRPPSRTRRKPMARRVSTMRSWPMAAVTGSGKHTRHVRPARLLSVRSAAVEGESTVTGAPHSWQCGRPTRAHSKRR